ncbi:MAG: hypothetical protein RL272_57 [Candidatus Parcubacteria bacterium]|jgi:hypothetical protein
MADDRSGICEVCAAKPRNSDEAPAALCGHLSRPDDSRFCVACAANHGVCRMCGKRSGHPRAEPES